MKQRRVTIMPFGAAAKIQMRNGSAMPYSSVAYWYQTGKHAHREELPPVQGRLPRRCPEHGLRDE